MGTLEGNKLSLDVTASGGELYKFDLASEGSTVMGDFTETLPNGERPQQDWRKASGDLKQPDDDEIFDAKLMIADINPSWFPG